MCSEAARRSINSVWFIFLWIYIHGSSHIFRSVKFIHVAQVDFSWFSSKPHHLQTTANKTNSVNNYNSNAITAWKRGTSRKTTVPLRIYRSWIIYCDRCFLKCIDRLSAFIWNFSVTEGHDGFSFFSLPLLRIISKVKTLPLFRRTCTLCVVEWTNHNAYTCFLLIVIRFKSRSVYEKRRKNCMYSRETF